MDYKCERKVRLKIYIHSSADDLAQLTLRTSSFCCGCAAAGTDVSSSIAISRNKTIKSLIMYGRIIVIVGVEERILK